MQSRFISAIVLLICAAAVTARFQRVAEPFRGAVRGYQFANDAVADQFKEGTPDAEDHFISDTEPVTDPEDDLFDLIF